MARTNFENLRVYQLSELLADKIWAIVITWEYFIKPIVDELAPKLNAYLKSIGKVPKKSKDN